MKRVIRSNEDFVIDYDLRYLDEEPGAWERAERRRKQREIDDENAEHDRTHGAVTSAISPFRTKYQVHWISPDGKDCLLGGSNNIEEANEIACDQAREIFESPFETNKRKFHFLRELYIVELPSEKDAMLTDTEDFIDNLMSELDSRMGAVQGSTRFPGSGSNREDAMRHELYDNYDGIDKQRIQDFFNIDWNDVVAEDGEDFLVREDLFPYLSDIKSIRYFNDEEQEWADNNSYDGGYVVTYSDGSEKKFAWTFFGNDMAEVEI